MSEDPTPIEDRVREQLHEVLDPCSCMTDTPVSIVELGLIDEIEVTDGDVYLRLIPTTPLCMYMAQIIDEARMEVKKLDEVDNVEIEQNVDDLWAKDRMSDDLREQKAQQAVQQQ